MLCSSTGARGPRFYLTLHVGQGEEVRRVEEIREFPHVAGLRSRNEFHGVLKALSATPLQFCLRERNNP